MVMLVCPACPVCLEDLMTLDLTDEVQKGMYEARRSAQQDYIGGMESCRVQKKNEMW